MLLVLREVRSVSRLDIRNLEDSEAIAGRDRSGVRALGNGKALRQERSSVGQSGYDTVLGEVVGRDGVKASRCRSLVQAILLGIRRKLRGEGLHGGAGLLLLQHRNDLAPNLCQRTKMRGLLEDVIPELRLDHVRGLTGIQGERRLVELGDGLAAIQPAELAALHLAARVVRVLRGEVGEVAAALDLLQQILSLGLGR